MHEIAVGGLAVRDERPEVDSGLCVDAGRRLQPFPRQQADLNPCGQILFLGGRQYGVAPDAAEVFAEAVGADPADPSDRRVPYTPYSFTRARLGKLQRIRHDLPPLLTRFGFAMSAQ
ncbi:hypothetical protein GCM10022239_26450 [Leifsonia bigeumensis]|uniref:Uncharacterized protein n=1 Tax=Leifsonella bigeumensis TaxID=433643 RepID=A0ABP7FYE0_9MICO